MIIRLIRHDEITAHTTCAEAHEKGWLDSSLVVNWIQEELCAAIQSGLMIIPSPIYSRIYLELSNSTLGHNQALKFRLVQFPYGFAHHCVLMGSILLFFYPLGVFVLTQNFMVAIVTAFCNSFGYMSMMEIAREAEEPFKPKYVEGLGFACANELPLVETQRGESRH